MDQDDIWDNIDNDITDEIILASQIPTTDSRLNGKRYVSHHDLTNKLNALVQENKTLNESICFFKHELHTSEQREAHKNEQYSCHLNFIKEKYENDFHSLKEEITKKEEEIKYLKVEFMAHTKQMEEAIASKDIAPLQKNEPASENLKIKPCLKVFEYNMCNIAKQFSILIALCCEELIKMLPMGLIFQIDSQLMHEMKLNEEDVKSDTLMDKLWLCNYHILHISNFILASYAQTLIIDCKITDFAMDDSITLVKMDNYNICRTISKILTSISAIVQSMNAMDFKFCTKLELASRSAPIIYKDYWPAIKNSPQYVNLEITIHAFYIIYCLNHVTKSVNFFKKGHLYEMDEEFSKAKETTKRNIYMRLGHHGDPYFRLDKEENIETALNGITLIHLLSHEPSRNRKRVKLRPPIFTKLLSFFHSKDLLDDCLTLCADTFEFLDFPLCHAGSRILSRRCKQNAIDRCFFDSLLDIGLPYIDENVANKNKTLKVEYTMQILSFLYKAFRENLNLDQLCPICGSKILHYIAQVLTFICRIYPNVLICRVRSQAQNFTNSKTILTDILTIFHLMQQNSTPWRRHNETREINQTLTNSTTNCSNANTNICGDNASLNLQHPLRHPHCSYIDQCRIMSYLVELVPIYFNHKEDDRIYRDTIYEFIEPYMVPEEKAQMLSYFNI